MLIATLAAFALLAEATSAAAPPVQAQPAAAQPAPRASGMVVSKKSNDYVCHKETVLGSSIPKRVCRSKSEAELERQDGRQFVEQIQASTPTLRGN